MANPTRVSTLILSGGTGSRTWTATAAVQDTAAGASVVITLATSTTGATPPVVETSYSLTLQVDNSGTVVRTFSPGVGFNGTQTFYFTVDGTSGAAIRAGFLRIVIAVAQSSGLAASQYNINSDSTGGTTPTGFTVTQADSGYIRGTTTAVTTLNAASYAYGDTITATTVLGAVPFTSRTVNVKLGALALVASAASSTATFTTAQGTADNRFAVSSNANATITTFPNAALVAVPWTTATAPTEASSTVDPRLTLTRLLQVNDNAFATPPTVKSVGTQRLTTDLGFIDSRFTNAAGVGVNGVTYNASLQDTASLVAARTRTGAVTTTQGGQAGWGTGFLSWPDGLPTGTWTHTATITSPASAVGLETPASSNFSLVASNPNLRLLCGAGPATSSTDARHFSPGVPLLVGLIVFNTATGQTVALDAGTPAVAIGRFNLTFGRGEYLQSDGTTWAAATGGTIYYFPATVSPGDANAYTVTIANTTSFSVADLFVVGRATVGGVPVSSFQKEITVNGINNHDKYAFDGAGFVGFPSK